MLPFECVRDLWLIENSKNRARKWRCIVVVEYHSLCSLDFMLVRSKLLMVLNLHNVKYSMPWWHFFDYKYFRQQFGTTAKMTYIPRIQHSSPGKLQNNENETEWTTGERVTLIEFLDANIRIFAALCTIHNCIYCCRPAMRCVPFEFIAYAYTFQFVF